MSVASIAPGGGRPLSRSMLVSALLHGSVIVGVVLWQGRPAPERPPVYKVNLVGAPAGPKNIGVVDPKPATTPPAAAKAPSGIERPPVEKVAPPTTKASAKPAPQATPTPTRTAQAGQADGTEKTKASAAPRAGSSTGGRGADVATIRTDGIDFPVPGYVNNIVRQVELRFRPDTRFENRPLRTEVSFLIHRDGHVSDIRVEQSSGAYSFDLDAQSAVESAGSAGAFGALPPEWTDDVLRVYFTFTPKGMR
jgi:periplasmic protein TonB